MKAIKTFITVVLLTTGITATAQRQEKVVDRVDQRTVQEFDHQDVTEKFQKHAFLDLQGGAQYTLGEAKFGDLLSPNLQLGLGYQFSPVFAGRFQVNAWQSKGGWNGYGNPPYTKDYSFDYVAPGLDLIFDLSNLIAGYNPTRVASVAAFIGGGANIAFHNGQVKGIQQELGAKADDMLLEYVWDGTKIRPFGRAGLQLNFRLDDIVDLFLEGNANILSDKYNSKKADNPDWYFNALAGLRLNLGKRYTKTLPPEPIPEPEPIPVVEPEPTPVVAPAPAPVVETVEPIRRDIFFLINKTDIRDTEAQKVKDIAYYLIKYPKAKVVVTGYADAGTGNDKINDRLAAQRADAVVKALQNQYGIDASRISYDSKGSRVQPFSDNDSNRVSICVAE